MNNVTPRRKYCRTGAWRWVRGQRCRSHDCPGITPKYRSEFVLFKPESKPVSHTTALRHMTPPNPCKKILLVICQVLSCSEPLLDEGKSIPCSNKLNVTARQSAPFARELDNQRGRFARAFR